MMEADADDALATDMMCSEARPVTAIAHAITWKERKRNIEGSCCSFASRLRVKRIIILYCNRLSNGMLGLEFELECSVFSVQCAVVPCTIRDVD